LDDAGVDPSVVALLWKTEDLVDAVNRQYRFIESLENIEWLRPGAFDTQVLDLQRAAIRYRA
jgi:hypothetical protein